MTIFGSNDSSYNTCSARKKLLTILCGLCIFLALSLFHLHNRAFVQEDPTRSKSASANKCSIDSGTQEKLAGKKKILGKQWIVVTTINSPTDAMDLLCNLAGWNVVVVADTKSPKEWTCGSCVYLSVEEQQCLNFGIVEVIPYRAYTRKNIGYLWAIQQGATTIFDTDDDNLPNTGQIVFEPPGVIAYRSDTASKRSVNIYSHFGRPDVWPRGFALSEIDIQEPTKYLPSYESLPVADRKLVGPPVLIQQGLADLDPDVDAIFRLTQVQKLKKIKFCKKSPSIRLTPGSFCPFNSQNTLFKHDAFWGLLLPITVSFRVCDIWRGYWVQRLLWDVNGSLGFTKPTVDQIRNAHNYHADFEDELQIYSDTTKFIEFLAHWTSKSTNLETRIIDLMKAMKQEKFIGAGDVDLAERWVKDLQRVGYVFPTVSLYNHEAVQKSLQTCRVARQSLVDSSNLSHEALKQCKAEAATDPPMAEIQITDGNTATNTATNFKDILLVVNFNWPTHKDVVKNVNNDDGSKGYASLIMAMEEHPNYSGYLYTNDDTVLNVRQLAQYDLDKVWKQVPVLAEDVHDRSKPPPTIWFHWDKPGTTAMWNDPTSLTEGQKKKIAEFTGVQGPADIRAFVDAVYVPGRIAPEVKDILSRFLKHNVFLELGVGLALVAVESPKNWVSWEESYLWYGGERDLWRDYLRPGVGMIHPVKLMTDKHAWDDIVEWIDSVEVLQ
ncbi:hypothetical protein BGZ65_004878 [Modicella reniformis]|uniref:Uncharacterized protein n=1 Tax=Modicella reniformis TaxID=1440133 RepID=A0A9P6M8R9_9FUNG|nr:hypothetical protein BGZ65_004878 [Modicella reniformis]